MNEDSVTREQGELTLRGLIIGVLLAVIMGSSGIYLTLKVGRTASMSIPATVGSMAILRRLRHPGMLENNIIQTTASAGEAVAAGIVFTLPALVLSGYWKHFSYLQVGSIATIGCVLGATLTAPLRRLMIVRMGLYYPSGVASALLIKSAETTGVIRGARPLAWGGVLGACSALLRSGFNVIAEKTEFWFVKYNMLFGAAVSLDVALFSTGFISGSKLAKAIFVGMIIRMICVAWYSYGSEIISVGDMLDDSGDFIAMVAIGTMIAGGLMSIVSITKAFVIMALRRNNAASATPDKKSHDIPNWIVAICACCLLVSIVCLFGYHWYGDCAYRKAMGLIAVMCMGMALLCAVVGAKMVGNSLILPLSGIIIMSIMLFSGLLLMWWGSDFIKEKNHYLNVVALVVIYASIIGVSTVVAADNMQDLKAGYILGATPWKQQLGIVIGGVSMAFVIGPVLEVLYNVYGFANVMPREHMDKAHALMAPQSNLVLTFVHGMLSGDARWRAIGLGAVIAFTIYVWNIITKRKLEPLTVALGIYLPIASVTALVIGGACRHRMTGNASDEENKEGIMFNSGVITGVGITMIILAVVLVANNGVNIMDMGSPPEMYKVAGSVIMVVILCISVKNISYKN